MPVERSLGRLILVMGRLILVMSNWEYVSN
jgi:hypothetical protein